MEVLEKWKSNKLPGVANAGYRFKCLIVCGMLLLFFASCTKDADVKLPELPSKLVVSSFISPQDSLIKVFINLSLPIYNKTYAGEYEPLTTASVSISSIYGVTPLAYNPGLKSYVADSSVLKVRAGVVYALQVTAPDGLSATAITQIPDPNQSLTFTVVPQQQDRFTHSMQAQWADPPATENYYRILVEEMSDYVRSGYVQGGVFKDSITSKSVTGALVKDNESVNGIISKNIPFSFGRILKSSDTIYVYLLHVSKEYYSYTEHLQAAYILENPFSEPVRVYSNIMNGYGIFAGYNQHKMLIPH